MDPLRFGPINDARSRWVAEGVVSGISGYGTLSEYQTSAEKRF